MMQRTLAPLVIALSILAISARPAAAQIPTDPLARVVSIVVQSVDLVEGELIATALVTLDVAGQTVTRTIEIPLNLDGSPGDADCDILNLSIGPVDLDLLGLVVELDDCEGGPVVIDIDAHEGEGILGDLLCGLAGALNLDLGDLGDLLEGLTEEELGELTDALKDVLNAVLADLLGGDSPVAAASHEGGGQGGRRRCDILTLEIPDGINLTVLGLEVQTSGICLDVYAERGQGNLLGNLLCTVTNLLNNRGNTGNAVQVHLRKVPRILRRL